VSLKLCRCGALTAVYWLTLRDQKDVQNVLCLQTSISVVGHPSQFLRRPACRLQFLQGYICNQRPVCWQRNEKVLQNLDNINLLKTEIAYNTSIFTAVTRNHGNGQKSRYTAKIMVITAIMNAWFSYSPNDEWCLYITSTRVVTINNLQNGIICKFSQYKNLRYVFKII